MPASEDRCTWVTNGDRCILTGRETPEADGRVLCREHRDKLIDAQVRIGENHERRMTRRASDARLASP